MENFLTTPRHKRQADPVTGQSVDTQCKMVILWYRANVYRKAKLISKSFFSPQTVSLPFFITQSDNNNQRTEGLH